MDRLHDISERIHGFNEALGRAVAWLTLAMVLLTFLIVVLRYGLDMGSIAVQEAVTYLHATVFMAGAAYTLHHRAHVRVDIFYRDLSERGKAWVNLLGCLLFLFPMCLFILWSGWDYVLGSWRLMEGSREAGGLPLVFLLKSLIPVLALTLIAEGVAMTIDNILILRSPQPDPDEAP